MDGYFLCYNAVRAVLASSGQQAPISTNKSVTEVQKAGLAGPTMINVLKVVICPQRIKDSSYVLYALAEVNSLVASGYSEYSCLRCLLL